MIRSLLSRLFGGGSSADRGSESAAQASADDPQSGDVDRNEVEERDEGNDLWDLIQSWEYDGKYVQSGGHSRGEQERALADIQRQAEEIERSEAEGESHPDQ